MPPAAIGAMIAVNAVTGLVGNLKAADTARDAGRAANAQAELNAESLEAVGELRADEARRSGRRLVGRQRAAFAKSGLAMSGSAMDVILDTEIENELAALHEKFGLDSAAFNERLAGIQAEAVGEARGNALTARGVQSILSGAASIASFATQAGASSQAGQSVFVPAPGPLQNADQGPLGSFLTLTGTVG